MKEQFVIYPLAKRLMALGFKDTCLGFYWTRFTYSMKEFEPRLQISTDHAETQQVRRIQIDIPAPLWQQGFDFLCQMTDSALTFPMSGPEKEYHMDILLTIAEQGQNRGGEQKKTT